MGKKALGKGLQALISSEALGEEGEAIRNIALSKIKSNRYQPRKSFNEESLNELAESIKKHGVIQPIVVKAEGENFEVIVGERRLRAAKMAGFSEIPAVVKEYRDDELLEIALIENIQREDLNPIEEAMAYKMVLERQNITQEELSKRVGKSRSYIANMVRLLELPEDVKEGVSRGTISVGQAKALLGIKDQSKLLEMYRRIEKEGMSVREVEHAVRKNVSRGTFQSQKKEPFIEDFENRLREKLGTKVVINYKNGRGWINIEFYSNEDLERIIDYLG
ncbi:hypothetical protein DRJ04_09540 [Candidatus Aerophobetes bacterium]|uniref:HTH cro/C1-type domain-containing protein n=1 Tax=Aerophobetes bacterium TaxID=2030807 RepID=A0A662D7M2_UNCAE|nr:MAG: hypothetical protein DRJ04_09540 [Candidatus Aerophobetes bacterium]